MSMIEKFDDLFELVTSNKALSITYDPINFDLFKYSGFDPIETLRKLMSVPSTTKLLDIQQMCYLFLARGTNIDNIAKRTSAEGAKKINTLKSRYGLVGSVRGHQKNSLGLARVAACCPAITISILSKVDDLSRPVSVQEMRDLVPGFPKTLMTSIAASLVPKTHPYNNTILGAITLYNMYETKKINNSMLNSNFKTVYNEARNYVLIAFKSDLVKEEKRIKLADSDIFDGAFDSSSCSSAVEEAAKYLETHLAMDSW